MMKNIGIVGCGQWGVNHLRIFYALPNCDVVMVADRNPDRFAAIAPAYPTIICTSDPDAILENPAIDAVVIATPSADHFATARKALLFDKDVLCEKPLALTAAEANELHTLAQQRHRILMVGHVFLYNSGIRKVKECIAFEECGRIHYLQATRTNLGPFRSDVNVVFDLAPHDISIFSHLLDAEPIGVSARGSACLRPGTEDVAFITLTYPNDVVANLHVSWLNPQKVRQITIVGDKRMLVWDELSPLGPVRIYDKGVDRKPTDPTDPTYPTYDNYGEFQLLARHGQLVVPHVDTVEPLKAQARHFLTCIDKRQTPLTDGRNGAAVVAVLEAINQSMKANGQPVEITHEAVLVS